jgi:hypothetical protein
VDYVRDLTIDISWYRNNLDLNILAFFAQVSEILAAVKGLERLNLTCSSSTSWLTFEEKFRTAFLACIRKVPLKEVSIIQLFAFPISVFADCKTIKSLTLDGVFSLPRSSVSFDELESLSLRVPSSSLSRIIRWAPLRNLRRLHFIPADPRDFRMLSHAFNGCPGLVDLDIDLSEHCKSRVHTVHTSNSTF